MSHEPEVLHEKKGGAGIATLNRPKALNALNTNMVVELYRLYCQWASDPTVHCVLLRGAGDKAFCAGGDIKAVVKQAQEGHPAEAAEFFRTEYRTNYTIQQLPKPHVALLDGITMGGGVGVSVHGPLRVATERTVFAMPECAIGLFPDVGGSWFLPRLVPCGVSGVGRYLALTGARLKGLEVLQAGVATHYVASSLLPDLVDRLAAMGPEACSVSALDAVIREYQLRAPLPQEPTPLERHLRDIEAAFSQPTLEQVYAALRQRGDDWGRTTLGLMQRGSPLSQRVTWRQLEEGGRLQSLRDCLIMENRVAYHMLALQSDFGEGVRAVLLDRDNAPKWRHGSIEEVTHAEVAPYFSQLPPDLELGLPLGPPGAARL